MSEPKWKTKRFTIVGWITFGLFMLIIAVDIVFALINKYITDFPTISNYVSERAEDQLPFLLIVLGIIIWLMFHWFYKPIKKWIKKD